MTDQPSHYQAYLLRLWRDDSETPWRAVLKDPRNDTVHAFATLTALYAFLDQQTEQLPITAKQNSSTKSKL